MRPYRSLPFLAAFLIAGCTTMRDTHEQLHSALWVQTAAEYRVLAETAYRTAGEALRSALADPKWSAATEQTADPSRLPPAVILDLDETVLDNSRYQAEQILHREPYSDPLWNQWVSLKEATLVPGAGEFLKSARAQGIAVFFVTNRSFAQEADTVANLTALGVQATADEVLCNKENGWTSDKTARRQFLAQKYRIVMLFGDDLGDFIPANLAPEARVQAAESHSTWWGTRWFLLPNPNYGSWERSLYNFDNTLTDEQILQRKRALLKGFAR